MNSLTRNILIGATVCAMAVIGLPALASATSTATVSATAEEAPPFAVEDFSYPDAARILTDKGIKLIKGDGHLLLADCNPAVPQIKVRTVADPATGRAGTYCFVATATAGWLTLELPRVTSLETSDHPIRAGLTADGQRKSVEVPKDEFVPVGEGDIPSGAKRSVLVDLRITG
ncbi:hypothetical protein [Streptomyces sp. NPDC058622]|uniref:hypothetical protein n=1 Tax=Streptomyces sp. NPDC058622 TaxID=3346562 RepID=UPI00365623DA